MSLDSECRDSARSVGRRRPYRWHRVCVVAGLTTVGFVLPLVVGASEAKSEAKSEPKSSPAGERHELIVFEAASLKDVFARLARSFEAEHPGTVVVTNAAGSQELRAQIEHGATADVFASADRKHMDALVAAGLVLGSSRFTCNEPVVVVRKALAPSLISLADLPRVERIVVGAPEVPIGAYTLQILSNADRNPGYGADFSERVQAKVVSRELSVRQVLAKVVLGEADAGVVYRSDVATAQGKVQVITIPPALNITAEYPIGLLRKAPSPALARQWLALVKSPQGATALREAGFVSCPAPSAPSPSAPPSTPAP